MTENRKRIGQALQSEIPTSLGHLDRSAKISQSRCTQPVQARMIWIKIVLGN